MIADPFDTGADVIFAEPPPDWRGFLVDEDDADDEQIETPPEVIAILGFDPAEEESTETEKFSLSQSRMTEQFQRAYFHCHTIEDSGLFWGSGGDGEVVDLQDGQVMKYTRRGGMVSCEGI